MSADGANSGKTDERSGEQTGEQTGEKAGESAAAPKGLSNSAQPVVRDVASNGAEPVVRDTRGAKGQSAGAEGEPVGDRDRSADAERAEPGGPESQSDGDADGDGDSYGDGDDLVVVDPVSAPDAEGKPRRATRRFPLFTRDTARPEGGGRAAPGDAPAPARQWPILLVLSLVALGLLLTALDVFRYGTILIGVALLGGAVLRWTVPNVGMLAVRSRFTDLVTYGVLGVAIVLLALMAQPDPWLEIPFLDDTLHFTVR